MISDTWITISLPAAIPSPPSPILFSLGPFTVRWYAIWIILGMGLAMWWSSKRWERRGGKPEFLFDMGLWVCVLGIVGARLMSVVSYPYLYFGAGIPWWQPFAIWQGGLAIYGGLIAGTLTIWIMARHQHLPLGPLLDSIAPTVLLAQSLGRLGNYFNQEVFGSATTLPWALQIDAAHLPSGYEPGTTFHPTFLYEIIWNLSMMGLILLYEKLRMSRPVTEPAGEPTRPADSKASFGNLGAYEVTALYFACYSTGRFFLEFVRIDSQATLPGGLRLFQLMALIVAVAAVALFVAARQKSLPAAL